MLLSVSGVVQHRSGRGHELGFPTVNVDVPDVTTNQYGVYAGYVIWQEKQYQAAIFVGPVELFGETKPQLEAHILDFDQDIYGETITVECLEKIREYEKFVNLEKLVQTINQDIITIKQCLPASPKK